MIDLVWRFSL